MAASIISTQTIYNDKTLYFIELNDKKYYGIFSTKLEKPIVYDEEYHDELSKMNWYISNGYVISNDQYMQRIISKIAKLPNFEDDKYSVNHINCIKYDNRIANLRMATQSEQNTNRKVRNDKKEPIDELKELGITMLPKYVRWDKGESKFTIDKHPRLVEEVSLGIRKKACQSGTKSVKLTIKEKYQDILARLDELNQYRSPDFIELQKKKNELLEEYTLMEKCIKEAAGIPFEELKTIAVAVEEIRKICPGKKGESKLPPNCGVTHDMIPKYCYYRPASDKRGDKFIIDKHHPKHVQLEIKQWGTTESRAVATKEKFDSLIERLKELEEIQPLV